MNSPAMPTGYQAPRTNRSGRLLQTCRGIYIGGAWSLTAPAMDGDALHIQSALLEPRTARPLPIWQRAGGAVVRWL